MCLSILGGRHAVCAITRHMMHTEKSQVYMWKETNVAFLECSIWCGNAVVANFHEETDFLKKGSAIPVHCFMNDTWILSGSSTLFAHTSLKRINKKVHIFRNGQVETECNRYDPSLPSVDFESLSVFAVYQHAIKDDLSLFTTMACFGSCISFSSMIYIKVIISQYCYEISEDSVHS